MMLPRVISILRSQVRSIMDQRGYQYCVLMLFGLGEFGFYCYTFFQFYEVLLADLTTSPSDGKFRHAESCLYI